MLAIKLTDAVCRWLWRRDRSPYIGHWILLSEMKRWSRRSF